MASSRLLRWLRWLVLLASAMLIALQGWLPLQAGSSRELRSLPRRPPIPIEQQPFYPELVREAQSWSDVVLDQVVGDSPRATLLSFYAVMAQVGERADRLGTQASLRDARASAAERREQIEDTELMFRLAVKALDASAFPVSVRGDMADEAAIQLKHVLDYVLTHSSEPIVVPDLAAMKQLNDQRTNPSNAWQIPGTAITLSSVLESDKDNEQYFFSSDTVSQIADMYREISDYPVIAQPFATPRFYSDFILTPGYLVPQDWYISLPLSLRDWLEIPILEQSVFQIASAIVVLVIYLTVAALLLRLILATYRYDADRRGGQLIGLRDALAWRRVLILLPLLPATRIAQVLIDDQVNFTGFPLVVITYLAYVIWGVSGGAFVFLFFEAVGRSGSETLARMRGGSSELSLQRASNFVMPLCRAVGALIAILIFYRLLIQLGLPVETVLALSAVPGLAIGLGASKLLGNLFAGLSIQTDRPLRVGEFCRVGDNLGYITKIGLRSLELQTLESRVTIPNSVVDEETIINYSRRGLRRDRAPMQGLDLRVQLDPEFSPYQLEELLRQAKRFLKQRPDLQEVVVTLERRIEDSAEVLVVYALVELHGWESYLGLREQMLLHLEELVERAQLSEIALSIAYGTSADQLQILPGLMRQVVQQDPQLQFMACRLERIAAFSYDHVLEFQSEHDNHDDFEDSLHDLNRRIIESLAAHGIAIPFPTQTLMLNSLHDETSP